MTWYVSSGGTTMRVEADTAKQALEIAVKSEEFKSLGRIMAVGDDPLLENDETRFQLTSRVLANAGIWSREEAEEFEGAPIKWGE